MQKSEQSGLLEVRNGGRQGVIGRVRRAEEIFKGFAKPEGDAALRVMFDLHLPQGDIVPLECLPAIACVLGIFVNAHLNWRDQRLHACFAGLAKLESEESNAKHSLPLDSFHANVLELAQDLLDNMRVNEGFLGDYIFLQGCPGCTILVRV